MAPAIMNGHRLPDRGSTCSPENRTERRLTSNKESERNVRRREALPARRGETPFSKEATGQQLARVRGCALFPAALRGPKDGVDAENDDDEVEDDLSRDD